MNQNKPVRDKKPHAHGAYMIKQNLMESEEKMEKKFYAMVLTNEEEVIVYQGDKEAVLAVQNSYDFNKYGMSLIETDKQVKVKNIQVSTEEE